MLAQIRIYTINKGEMDAFLTHFRDQIAPLHEQAGIPIVGCWVNRPQNEVIWIRTFADESEREARVKRFQESARAGGVVLGANVAKMEVREAEPALVAAATAG